MKHITIFGAGSVGRGFIGQVFSEAGWRVTFVDTDATLVEALNSGSYRHVTISDESAEERWITGVEALDGRDVESVSATVASTDFVATAVGSANMRHIAPVLAEGLRRRILACRGPLDILLAENLHDASGVLRGLLAEHLGERSPEILDSVGTLETSIGRMIPVPNREKRREDPSWIAVEPYRELPLDCAAAKAPLPNVADLVCRRDIPFSFFSDRKLYLHNLGHCMTAYLGELLGDSEIADAICRPDVFRLVEAVMDTVARALSLEYGEPFTALRANVDDLLKRFSNRALHDTVDRVGRDPQRKMAEGDRFLGAFAMAARHGMARPVTIAVALGTHKLLRTVPPDQHDQEYARIRDYVLRVGGEDELGALADTLATLAAGRVPSL